MKMKNFKIRLNRNFLFKIVSLFIGSILIVLSVVNVYISVSTSDKLYDDTASIPYNKVGLLLGTAKHMNNNALNPYYQFRVDAAVELYKAGKIEFILVSGDNSLKTYNEPLKFKEDLMKEGIPENKIYLDYAGFRTLASVVRAKKVFGINKLTIISQKSHNERALFLAKHFNIEAVGFNAQNVYGKNSIRTRIRGSFAKVKAVLDIIFNVEPKYLGEPIKIK
ncbi:vancomycin high temperature exclusion protein [Aequorivita antarctica]|uniref:Vancomycin high temperature exclusion protein n=2 Tax=Aequorivita antarctica TaxID=153266 RepID=A0A5C6YYM5_9FLAO|nr:vancomycin high temperature exclusion protein [Aequorivita antarctica]